MGIRTGGGWPIESLLSAAYLFGVAASFVRGRLLHVLVYAALMTIVLGDPLLLVVPVVLCTVVWAGLSLSRKWSNRRASIVGMTFVLLTASWLGLKFPQFGLSTAINSHLSTPLLPVHLLGISYLYLKLAHMCLDALRGLQSAPSYPTMLGMVLFPPTYAAGPIHRYDEFTQSFRNQRAARERDWMEVARRVALGLFKTRVLSYFIGRELVTETLAAPSLQSPASLWLALYGYSLYIYFNFAGISDIAIGVGEAFGIRVPENFRSPYLRCDIQQFWQHWHMTLTRWLQAYVFMPLSKRLMRTRLRKRPQVVAWIAYLVTFGFCGLWHGEGANFLVWGLWHGLGLCVYTSLPRRLKAPVGEEVARTGWRSVVWWALTFTFVSVGWVFFACPLPQATNALQRMLGLG